MKRVLHAAGVICSILLISACNKLNLLKDHFQDQKLFQLKEFVFEGSSFRLYYDRMGFVDSVQETAPDFYTVVHVIHHGCTIDSVTGDPSGTITNIGYDDSGRVIGYNVFMRSNPLRPPTVFTFDYQPNNVLVITKAFIPPFIRTDELHFDADHDATGWNVIQRPTADDLRAYTFDGGQNPLFLVKDAEVFLNTQFEQIFSRHNALTKIYYLHPGFQVNYQNRYDQHRRLVKKVYTELDRSHPDSVEYRYFIK